MAPQQNSSELEINPARAALKTDSQIICVALLLGVLLVGFSILPLLMSSLE
jgi:hypothetical protein